MKALSVHPYYAIGIVIGDKTVECRSWTTKYRGDILICSTAKKEKGLIPSHALGIVELSDIVPFESKHLEPARMEPDVDYDGLFAWVLSKPRLIKPFPVKGKLSLWNCEHEIEFLEIPEDDPEGEEFFKKWWGPIIL